MHDYRTREVVTSNAVVTLRERHKRHTLRIYDTNGVFVRTEFERERLVGRRGNLRFFLFFRVVSVTRPIVLDRRPPSSSPRGRRMPRPRARRRRSHAGRRRPRSMPSRALRLRTDARCRRRRSSCEAGHHPVDVGLKLRSGHGPDRRLLQAPVLQPSRSLDAERSTISRSLTSSRAARDLARAVLRPPPGAARGARSPAS